MTLLHYLVETIESKFPELLTFNEDLAHVDKAARVPVETIQKTLRQMDANVRNLENDLNNNKQPQGDDDMFSEVMGVSFPPVVKPLDSFPAFYGTQRFIIAFTRALRLTS
jgi:hypothetical protein